MAEILRGVHGGEKGRGLADDIFWREEGRKKQQQQQQEEDPRQPPPLPVPPPLQQQQACPRYCCVDFRKGNNTLPRAGVRKRERGVTWYDQQSGRPRALSEGSHQEPKLRSEVEGLRAHQAFKLSNELEGEEGHSNGEFEGEGDCQTPKLSNEFEFEGKVSCQKRILSKKVGEGGGGDQAQKLSNELEGEERKLTNEFGEGGYGRRERSHRPQGEQREGVEERRGRRGVRFRPAQTDVPSCTRGACLSPSAGTTVPDDLQEGDDNADMAGPIRR